MEALLQFALSALSGIAVLSSPAAATTVSISGEDFLIHGVSPASTLRRDQGTPATGGRDEDEDALDVSWAKELDGTAADPLKARE